VIIVSWNVRDDLLRCITALLGSQVSGGPAIEVIVVDNASHDGTVQALSDLPVTLIANPVNIGYGRGNNIGLRAARGKHLLILNPDTIPQAGMLEPLINFTEENPRAAIVAPRLLNADGTVQPAAFSFPTLPMAAIDLFPLPSLVPGRFRVWLRDSSINGRYRQETSSSAPFMIDHPLGACFLIRREAFEQCGGFDEHIFIYSEEIDLALRYTRAGWQCWQVPASRVVHLGGQSTRQMPERMFVELWRSRLYLYSKHYSLARRLLLKYMVRAAMLRDLAAVSFRRLVGINRENDEPRLRRAKAVIKMTSRL
jgi:N-acetylglucosaminyl-diphospho-decaprenol L-rhamnosyltransferase